MPTLYPRSPVPAAISRDNRRFPPSLYLLGSFMPSLSSPPSPAAFVFESLENCSTLREPLIKWERHLLEAIGPYFKARAKRQYPQRSCPSEQRRKMAQALPALRVALKRGRGCVGAAVTPQGGCSCIAALPAEEEEGSSGGWRAGEPASFECNKCLSHLISGSLD
jgi:hypothetical protein